MSAADTILHVSIWIGLALLVAAFLLTTWRVIQGPTLPDRVVALDMLVGIVIGFIALIAIRTGFTLYVDIAIALGLVGFLATVAFARFILASAKADAGSEGAVEVDEAAEVSPPSSRPTAAVASSPAAAKPKKPAKPSATKGKSAVRSASMDEPKSPAAKTKPQPAKGAKEDTKANTKAGNKSKSDAAPVAPASEPAATTARPRKRKGDA